jgi:hypothetical protein
MNVRTKISWQNIRNCQLTASFISRSSSNAAATTVADNTVSPDTPKKVKHRVPQKRCVHLLSIYMSLLLCIHFYFVDNRASKLLNELKTIEFDKLKNGRDWPLFRAGDAIEVKVRKERRNDKHRLIIYSSSDVTLSGSSYWVSDGVCVFVCCIFTLAIGLRKCRGRGHHQGSRDLQN